MANGISAFAANGFFDAIGNNTSLAIGSLYMKLHVGAPGAAGTNNPATETTRKHVAFGSAAGGSIVNDVAVTWTNINGSQDATDFTLWDSDTAGNFVGSGAITANSYTAGDTYNIAIGGCVLSLTLAS